MEDPENTQRISLFKDCPNNASSKVIHFDQLSLIRAIFLELNFHQQHRPQQHILQWFGHRLLYYIVLKYIYSERNSRHFWQKDAKQQTWPVLGCRVFVPCLFESFIRLRLFSHSLFLLLPLCSKLSIRETDCQSQPSYTHKHLTAALSSALYSYALFLRLLFTHTHTHSLLTDRSFHHNLT